MLTWRRNGGNAVRRATATDNTDRRRYMNLARPARAFGVEERMTGTTRSSEGLDVRRRKLLFRSWHRGMREMDLIMGGFADSAVADLAETELVEFERLIEVPDREILAWVTGEEVVPAEQDTPLFRRLRDFHLAGERRR